MDELEQQIIVTPDSEENGDQTSYFVRPVPIVKSILEDASESDKTNSGVGGWVGNTMKHWGKGNE
jgi:hypothetical protein